MIHLLELRAIFPYLADLIGNRNQVGESICKLAIEPFVIDHFKALSPEDVSELIRDCRAVLKEIENRRFHYQKSLKIGHPSPKEKATHGQKILERIFITENWSVALGFLALFIAFVRSFSHHAT